ncbi:3-isopropylmalate dehydratase small subunit [Candidimonas nitroreducens]|uniref:3-isopropylmalate dehydratase small subunit n=1 Tax=Candidimonas nitroreducens TaxID=683354 RepID=A0A225MWK9_9BURK|nr:3-isopropylmalate dehydratase small subunit [Candidimonas nitroreducens]OWT63961.1 3-isopropylmalate dehydratase small subunit [Candidimonas nitroreducens]
MKPFNIVRSRVVPLDISNCDTDQIVPGRFLSRTRSAGFSEQLFHDLRYESGRKRPEFPMNRPEFSGAELIVAGANFACGSSRESAVWALVDSGIRAVLAPSFGDIFFGNAFKNGLLPVQLPAVEVERIMHAAQAHPEQELEIDLPNQDIRCGDGSTLRFDIDALRKQMLRQGVDEITFTLTHECELAAFERGYDARQPWLAAATRAVAAR